MESEITNHSDQEQSDGDHGAREESDLFVRLPHIDILLSGYVRNVGAKRQLIIRFARTVALG